MAEDEVAHPAQLDDPTERAKGFAQALIGTIEHQQRRLKLAEDENRSLRRRVENLETDIEHLRRHSSIAPF